MGKNISTYSNNQLRPGGYTTNYGVSDLLANSTIAKSGAERSFPD